MKKLRRFAEIECVGDICVGDCVDFTYTHWLNAKSFTTITKTGHIIRMVIPRDGSATKYAIVKFEENKRLSRVLIRRLRKCRKENEDDTV